MSFEFKVDGKVLTSLAERGYTIEDLFVVICYRLDSENLLRNYLSKRTDDQRYVFFQRLVRKQIVRQICNLEDFDWDNYELNASVLTELAEAMEIIVPEASQEVEVVTDAIGTVVEGETIRDEMSEFVDKYMEYFPKGLKNGAGCYLKGNRSDVRTKLLKFMNKYKNFNREMILKATETYIKGLRGNYTYCSTAEYFILKDGISKLATECENIANGTATPDNNPFEQTM